MGKNSNQRADRFNPNNSAFKAAENHKANIYNPTSSEFKAAESNRLAQLSGNNSSENIEPGGKSVETKP